MHCSQRSTCEHPCDNNLLPQEFSNILHIAIVNMAGEPHASWNIIEQLSTNLEAHLDAADFCNLVFNHTHSNQKALPALRSRILDRAIVYKFEQLYIRLINILKSRNVNCDNIKTFFKVVPRGECLDLFLQLIKDYCIGDAEFQTHHIKLQRLCATFTTEEKINWPSLYKSEEYEIIMQSLFTIIFKHIKNHTVPIPAVNIKIKKKYQPERINHMIKHLHRLWLLDCKQSALSMKTELA